MITVMLMIILTYPILNFSLKSNNPVKSSSNLMLIASLTFSIMCLMNGSSWFSLIFLLLFLGGILMMFMILSSLMPNEKALKMNYPKSYLLANLAMLSFIPLMCTSDSKNEMKWMLKSSINIEMMLLLILSYFFVFISLISMNKFPMRSMMCY